MLDTQLIDIEFRSGADTKTTDKNVVATRFREIKNFRMDKIGAVVPRGGINVVPSTYDALRDYQAFDLATSGRQTAYLADNKLYSVAPEADNIIEVSPALRGALSRIYGGDAFYGRVNIAATTTQVCLFWTQYLTDKAGILVLDAATDEVLIQTEVAYSQPTAFQLLAVGDKFYLIYVTGGFDIAAQFIDTTNLSNPFTNLVWNSFPTGTTAMKFAATAAANGKIYVHYCSDSSTTSTLQVVTLSNGGLEFTGVDTTNALTFSSNPEALAITRLDNITGQTVAIAGIDVASTVRGSIFDASGVRVGSEQNEAIGSIGTLKNWWMYEDSTSVTRPAVLGWQTLDSSSEIRTQHYTFSSSADTYTSVTTGAKGYVTCGPVVIEGRPISVVDTFTEGTYGSQALVITKTGSNTIGTSLATAGVGANLGQFLFQIASTSQLSPAVLCSGKYYFPVSMITALSGITPPDSTSTTLVYPTLHPKVQATILALDVSYQAVSVFDTTNRQSIYMGTQSRILETSDQVAGTWPEVTIVPSADLSLVAGSLSGVYSFCFAKVYRSPTGHEYRTYSPIYTATLASKKLQYVIRAQLLVGCTGIEAYRTEAGGTIFYRSNSALTTTAGTYTDDTTDADLIGGRLADINGNELAPEPIPTVKLACYYNGRLAVVTADNENEVWFNRPSSFPSGTSFSTGIKLSVASEGGPLTGIHSMNSALYLFKRNSVSVVYGDPAGLTGENGTLTEPKTLYNGVGCVEPRSLVLTQNGLVFESGKGFYLIAANNQGLQFIGTGPFNDRSATITGASVSQNEAEVVFSFSNGSVWVLNVDTGAWYEWTTTGTVRGLAGTDGRLYMAKDTGVYEYDTDTTTDSQDGSAEIDIAQDITTGWIRLTGIAGYQRVKRLIIQADADAPCTITVDVYTDYSSTSVQTETIDSSLINPVSPGAEIGIHLKVQKCEALSFRIRTNRHGVSIQGCTLEIGAKAGTNKSRSTPV